MTSLMQVKGLKVQFHTLEGTVYAVNGITYNLGAGENLGIVGESGCGKSVSVLSVLQLIPEPPGKIAGGEVLYRGEDLLKYDKTQMEEIRGKEIAMTMQDALTALNPALTIGFQIMEVLLAHGDKLSKSPRARKREARDQAIEMMKLVGIPSPETRLDEYPHQFSGGMRQRMMIAIALACRPKLLIADEPTTALDVTIQAQVLELVADIRQKLGMSVILITHDLGVVAEYCDRIAVMYAGQVIESGPTKSVIGQPTHPYTQGLLRSIPNLAHLDQRIRPIEGQVPELIDLPPGCRFIGRCNQRQDACTHPVEMHSIGPDLSVRCVLAVGGGK